MVLSQIDPELRALVHRVTGSALPDERAPALFLALDELEARAPALYARVMAGLIAPLTTGEAERGRTRPLRAGGSALGPRSVAPLALCALAAGVAVYGLRPQPAPAVAPSSQTVQVLAPVATVLVPTQDQTAPTPPVAELRLPTPVGLAPTATATALPVNTFPVGQPGTDEQAVRGPAAPAAAPPIPAAPARSSTAVRQAMPPAPAALRVTSAEATPTELPSAKIPVARPAALPAVSSKSSVAAVVAAPKKAFSPLVQQASAPAVSPVVPQLAVRPAATTSKTVVVSPASKTKPVAVTPASAKPPARDVPATASKDSSLFLTGSLDQFNNDGSLTVPGTSDLQLQGTAVPTAPVPPAP